MNTTEILGGKLYAERLTVTMAKGRRSSRGLAAMLAQVFFKLLGGLGLGGSPYIISAECVSPDGKCLFPGTVMRTNKEKQI